MTRFFSCRQAATEYELFGTQLKRKGHFSFTQATSLPPGSGPTYFCASLANGHPGRIVSRVQDHASVGAPGVPVPVIKG